MSSVQLCYIWADNLGLSLSLVTTILISNLVIRTRATLIFVPVAVINHDCFVSSAWTRLKPHLSYSVLIH